MRMNAACRMCQVTTGTKKTQRAQSLELQRSDTFVETNLPINLKRRRCDTIIFGIRHSLFTTGSIWKNLCDPCSIERIERRFRCSLFAVRYENPKGLCDPRSVAYMNIEHGWRRFGFVFDVSRLSTFDFRLLTFAACQAGELKGGSSRPPCKG